MSVFEPAIFILSVYIPVFAILMCLIVRFSEFKVKEKSPQQLWIAQRRRKANRRRFGIRLGAFARAVVDDFARLVCWIVEQKKSLVKMPACVVVSMDGIGRGRSCELRWIACSFDLDLWKPRDNANPTTKSRKTAYRKNINTERIYKCVRARLHLCIGVHIFQDL